MSSSRLKKDLVLEQIAGRDYEDVMQYVDEIAREVGCSPTYVRRIAKEMSESKPLVLTQRQSRELEEEEEEELRELASEDALILGDKREADEWEDWFKEDEPEAKRETEDGEVIRPEPKAPKVESVFYESDAGTILDVVHNMIAEFTGFDGFRLKPQERKQLEPLAHRMMEKYFSVVLDKYALEALFCITLIAIEVPKIRAYRDHAERARQEFEIASARAEAEAAREEARKLQAQAEKLLAERQLQAELDASKSPKPIEDTKPRTREEAGVPDWAKEK